MILGSDDIHKIASYIVSGVEFLCSGVIFKDSGNVRGLNTAATLWCTAAIGVLPSSGKYIFAFTAARLLIFSNLLFRPLARRIYPIVETEENEQMVRALLIHRNQNKKLFLINLESINIPEARSEIQAELSY